MITQEFPGDKAAGNDPQLLVWVNCFAFEPPSTMLLIVSGAMVPVFITVTVCGALVVPCCWLPKLSEAGDRVKAGRTIIPVSDTDCEVAGVATFTFKDAVLVSVLVPVGANVTLIVQLTPDAMPVPPIGQLLVCANCPGFEPVRPMLLMIRAEVPVLVTVTD